MSSETPQLWSEAPRIGEVVEQSLYEHGFETIEDVKESSVEDLKEIPRLGSQGIYSLYNYVESQESEDTVEPHDPNVLPDGAEIHFTDDRDTYVPDRVEFLPGGFVKCIYKHNYSIEVYPQSDIEGIYTHTNHLEDQDWW